MHCFNSNCKLEHFFHYAVLFYFASRPYSRRSKRLVTVARRELAHASYLSCKAKFKDKSTSGSEYRNVIKINENEFSTPVKIMSGEAF